MFGSQPQLDAPTWHAAGRNGFVGRPDVLESDGVVVFNRGCPSALKPQTCQQLGSALRVIALLCGMLCQGRPVQHDPDCRRSSFSRGLDHEKPLAVGRH
jgi:hypothetical protein